MPQGSKEKTTHQQAKAPAPRTRNNLHPCAIPAMPPTATKAGVTPLPYRHVHNQSKPSGKFAVESWGQNKGWKGTVYQRGTGQTARHRHSTTRSSIIPDDGCTSAAPNVKLRGNTPPRLCSVEESNRASRLIEGQKTSRPPPNRRQNHPKKTPTAFLPYPNRRVQDILSCKAMSIHKTTNVRDNPQQW
jgi:hypothetical protein